MLGKKLRTLLFLGYASFVFRKINTFKMLKRKVKEKLTFKAKCCCQFFNVYFALRIINMVFHGFNSMKIYKFVKSAFWFKIS